jgi:hypothetical protein
MQAPVAGAATPRLASEVSRAGGLGSLSASWTEVGVLREQIRSIRRETDRPFCVNLVLDFEQDERLEPAGSETLDRDRERGFPSPLHFNLGEPNDRDEAVEVIRELQEHASRHEQDRKAAQKNARARPVVAWRGLLSLLREHEAEQEAPLRYIEAEGYGDTARLRLAQPAPVALLGELRVAPGEGGRDFAGEVTAVNDPWVTLTRGERSVPSLAPSGTLRRDRLLAVVPSYVRQLA